MNRRREKQERDERLADAELMALRAQTHARQAIMIVSELTLENTALRSALIRKRIVTPQEVDAEKPKPLLPIIPNKPVTP